MDENLSWYIDESIKEFSPDKALLDKNDEAFKHGNLIHGKLNTTKINNEIHTYTIPGNNDVQLRNAFKLCEYQ